MPKPLASCPSLPAYKRGCRCDGCRAAKADSTARYAERNRERVREWQKANPEQRKEQRAIYRVKHRAELRASGRAYQTKRQAEDPEAIRANRRNWAKTDKGRLANRLARHARRGAPTDKEYAEILLRDPCSYCGEVGGEIDHITPLSAGGSGDWENLTSACRRHNAAKNDRTLVAFLAER